MKNLQRAQRRAHRERLKRKRKNYWALGFDLPVNQKFLAKMVNTPKPCSCYMCGNPRKFWKEKSLDERRHCLHSEIRFSYA